MKVSDCKSVANSGRFCFVLFFLQGVLRQSPVSSRASQTDGLGAAADHNGEAIGENANANKDCSSRPHKQLPALRSASCRQFYRHLSSFRHLTFFVFSVTPSELWY